MKNTLETRLGIFVALAVIAAVLILETVGGVRIRPGYHVMAQFRNVADLKVGDRVKMGGVEIGRVEKIPSPKSGKVLVEMKLRKEAEVKTDSVATVKFAGLMGENYIDLSYGSPEGYAATNETYLATSEQPDLSAIMKKLDDVASGVQNITKSFSGDQISNLLGPFTDFLKANQGPLTVTIANIQRVTSQMADQVSHTNGTLGKLLFDETLYNSAVSTVTNLQGTATEIQGTVAEARRIVDQINSGQGTVGKLLKDETMARELTASATNLKEILQKINQGQGSVGKLINDQEFYRNAKLSLQKLDKATEGLEDQGPLSVLGILVNNLF